MINTKELELRNSCAYYTSYVLPNNCILFVAEQIKKFEKDGEWVSRDATFSEKTSNLSSTFSSAMIAGHDMIRKGECVEFCLQTVECVKDQEDTGMIILMTKGA